ncbi:MAG: hypothetical protein GY862_08475 [Gammaproteobacteria bacterium]|nr:hypothetical protein [Gammaproteobacteria bacterium]
MKWICTNNLNRAETCLINDASPKVIGFGAGKTIPKTAIGARLYPSYAVQPAGAGFGNCLL